MLLPCDTAVRLLATPLRAAVARELIVRHRLTQDEVAEMLGVTQAAVSQYASGVRGRIEGRVVRESRTIVTRLASALVLDQLVSVRFQMESGEPVKVGRAAPMFREEGRYRRGDGVEVC